jgi:hypothetical protein
VKAAIRADGVLVVIPETDLEAFAVNCWLEKNVPGDWFNAAHPPALKVAADLSAFADRMGLFIRATSAPPGWKP